jgi:tRNA(Ile)-lysidine synthase TilS/MesJ
MTKCDKCQRRAVIHQRYSGKYLCSEHFDEDVHRKIREGLRKTGLFGRDARIAVGLDGGRKSATLAFVLKNLFICRRDIDLLAVIIDEGRKSSPTADQARRVATQLCLPYVVKSLLLPTLLPLLPEQETPHTVHTSLKRELLFRTAAENGAGILATGETLDDEALEIFLGYLQGNADASISKEGTVAWIKPLRRIPEKEMRLYAVGHDLGFADAGEKSDALHRETKRLLYSFDCRHPGTFYSLLRGLEKSQAQDGPCKGKAFK